MWLRQVALAAFCAVATPDEGETCPAGGCDKESGYLWPNVRGLVGRYGVSSLTGPKDLSKPSWRWHHENGQYHGVIVGGPVIDHERNLYFTETRRLLKMSPDGKVIWSATCPNCTFPDGPTIHSGAVFQSTHTGMLCKFSMDTGAKAWCRKYFPSTGMDSKYVTSFDGIVVIGSDNAAKSGGGSKHVLGLAADTGEMVWKFAPDSPTWNNMGIFTHDDTVLLQDWDARVYCLGLHNGSLLWKNGGSAGRSFTDGGTLVGANGIVYAHSATGPQERVHDSAESGGISAYRLGDGQHLWSQRTRYGVFTFPVAGQLHGDDRWSVVTASGPIPGCNPVRKAVLGMILDNGYNVYGLWLLWQLAAALRYGDWRRSGIWKRALWRLFLIHVLLAIVVTACVYLWVRHEPEYPADITAFDAETGTVRWHYDLPTWDRVTARGDEEGYFTRIMSLWWRDTCCPASFGSPTVDGDGVVYIGHASGLLYAIQDRDGNGFIDETSEVRTFDAEAAFLHSGPAFAPGLFAFTTCDSLWVWRT